MKCIYLRTNTVNGKQYVGQTNDMKKRDYYWVSLKCRYSNWLIQQDREKYGLDKWETKVLKECDDSESDYWEEYYIKEYNTKYPNGYNMSDGGKGVPNVFVSEETKDKISKAKKGKHLSKETVEKMKGRIPWIKGKYHTEESKQKMSKALHRFYENGGVPPMKGKCHTEESKQKMSVSHKQNPSTYWMGKHRSEETKKKLAESNKGHLPPNIKKVYQYTLEGEFVREWESTCEASRNGFNQALISACCRGKRNKHKGFKWSYTKKEDTN